MKFNLVLSFLVLAATATSSSCRSRDSRYTLQYLECPVTKMIQSRNSDDSDFELNLKFIGNTLEIKSRETMQSLRYETLRRLIRKGEKWVEIEKTSSVVLSEDIQRIVNESIEPIKSRDRIRSENPKPTKF